MTAPARRATIARDGGGRDGLAPPGLAPPLSSGGGARIGGYPGAPGRTRRRLRLRPDGKAPFRSAFMRVRFASRGIGRGDRGEHGARLGEIDAWETVRRADVRALVGREVGRFAPPLIV